MNWRCRSWLYVLCVWVASHPGSAADASRCTVCDAVLSGTFYWVSSPTHEERLPVCLACAKSESVCFTCGLPVGRNSKTLTDGRLLCAADAKVAVFTSAELEHIFRGVERELYPFFQGTGHIPEGNITLELVDGYRLRQLQPEADAGTPARTLGMTHSLKRSGRCYHQIAILNGLPPMRVVAVAAHEWTHAWLFENLPGNRRLHADAAEGFCELVAYRVMRARSQRLEQKAILANSYTAGQIGLLADTESDAQFRRVLDWIQTGQENRFTPAIAEQLIARNYRPPFEALWRPSVVTPVPQTLTLKGISGSARRRYALVNNQTLQPHETATVRVGRRTVVVRCLEIGANSVRLQVDGEAAPVELRLNGRSGLIAQSEAGARFVAGVPAESN